MGPLSTIAVRTLRKVGRKAGSLRGSESGSSAVELALIAVPFFMLLCAVFEAGLVMLAQQSLGSGVDRASRQLFTGAFQAKYDGTPSAERFRTEMCPVMVYVDCAKVLIEITTASTFAGSGASDPYDSKTKSMKPNFGKTFECPSANEIVTVRAAAVVPRFFGFLTLNGLQMASGGQMVTSTAIFRAEPYPAGKC